jgi:2-polyprenyl-3-methyl-5-hydroxy-6-metoxy-1,4-benzoquinol methylase
LLDIGCSFGLFLTLAKNAGYIVTGVETAVDAAKSVSEQGLNIKCGYVQDLNLPESYYDVITLFEVIEHLASPVELLKECYRILRPGGLLLISTGNTDSWTASFLKENWDYFHVKGHISFFNTVTLQEIARLAGFSVVSLETRRVKTRNKQSVSTFQYTIAKIMNELLSLPAKILNKGHDVFLILTK